MKKLLYLCLGLLSFQTNAQLLEAHLDEQGNIHVDTLTISAKVLENRSSFQQLAGFPKAFVGAPIKNFRNLTLADLNDDGAQEIIAGINNQLHAFSYEGLLWTRDLVGIATYPPTVADINADGRPEIAVATRGLRPSDAGRLYLVDSDGKDWTGDWPRSFNNNWVLSAPVFSDLNGDGMMEVIATDFDSPIGSVQVLNMDGSNYSNNWPQILPAPPAVTPSVGDVDGDGAKEIVVFSTRAQYVFNLDGSIAEGYPVEVTGLKHSYQSPVLADLNRDGALDIISVGHGDAPEYFVRDGRGNYLEGWPQAVPNNRWTFSPPSLLEVEGSYQIFMSRPNEVEASDMLYAWNEKGRLDDGFPISKVGGLEGLICIADVDDDTELELVFGSNLLDTATQTSFLHAYEMDGSGEVAGFPIRPKGWTFMSGATLGDVNGDGRMDAVLLTYTQNLGASTDSAFIHAYDLGVPYSPERIQWGTYKGSNSRDGNFAKTLSTVSSGRLQQQFSIFPNPSTGLLNIELEEINIKQMELYDAMGRSVRRFSGQERTVDLQALAGGVYFLLMETDEQEILVEKIVIK
ncbi:MAG: T9SS type A sorting domain-containing protein [Bacteroidota bacterium]